VIETQERTVTVWQDRVRIRVLSKGHGPALVFFHGPWGLTWDPFLDELARSFTVLAPEHPGTTPEAHDDIYHLDGLWDLVLCYDELLEVLGLESAVFVGHSFGGMVACEVAAAYPARARRLALLAPLGFWRDPDRIINWMMLEPGELRRHIFHDPECDAARRMFPPSDAHDATAADREIHLAHPGQRTEEADPPRHGAHAARLGQGGPSGPGGLRGRVHAAPPERPRADGGRCRPRSTSRATRKGRPSGP